MVFDCKCYGQNNINPSETKFEVTTTFLKTINSLTAYYSLKIATSNYGIDGFMATLWCLLATGKRLYTTAHYTLHIKILFQA